mgnify:CR=1 FL=1
MGISRYEEEGYSTTIGVVDGVAWFEDGTSVNNVTVELIRAAPDLLDALQSLLAAFDSDFHDLMLAKMKAQASVAKAKGGE